VAAGFEDEWPKAASGLGCTPSYMGEGSGECRLPENFLLKINEISAFLWHLRKCCWPFYALFYVVIAEMPSMDADDDNVLTNHDIPYVHRSQEIYGGSS